MSSVVLKEKGLETMTSLSYIEKSGQRPMSPQPFGQLRASLDLSLWQANHILERLNVAMEKVDGALETLEGSDDNASEKEPKRILPPKKVVVICTPNNTQNDIKILPPFMKPPKTSRKPKGENKSPKYLFVDRAVISAMEKDVMCHFKLI